MRVILFYRGAVTSVSSNHRVVRCTLFPVKDIMTRNATNEEKRDERVRAGKFLRQSGYESIRSE